MGTKARMVNLHNIPSVDDLKRALVGVIDNRCDEMVKVMNLSSIDKLRRIATIARDLCKKKCFFCGEKSDPKMAKADKLKWEDMPVCNCLAPMRAGARVYIQWKGRVNIIANEVDAWFIAKGKGLAADLEPNTLNPERVVYSNRCSRKECGKPFSIKAKTIAGNVRKYGTHTESHLCLECKRAMDVRKKTSPQTAGPIRAASHAAVPQQKQPRLKKVTLQIPAKKEVGMERVPTLEELEARLEELRARQKWASGREDKAVS